MELIEAMLMRGMQHDRDILYSKKRELKMKLTAVGSKLSGLVQMPKTRICGDDLL